MQSLHPEFVVDAKNNPKAVLLSLPEWESLLEELEELEDIRAYDAAKQRQEESIPLEQAVRESSPGLIF